MKILQHKFIETIPKEIEEGYIYITLKYNTAIHKCVCGCGHEVVTPITPTDWNLTYDGKTISLYPSIGSWNLDCKSHYFITKSVIHHCSKWSDTEIKKGREKKKKRKKFFWALRKKDE